MRAAAADAGASGSAELARLVGEAAASAGRADRVAALLATVDAGGQALHEIDDALAGAAAAAGDDPVLAAAVELRAAVRANIGAGDPVLARAAAARSAELARRGGDRAGEAMALTMRARMERITGDPAAAGTLAAALDLDVPIETIGVQRCPQYLAARHAVFDDRLDEARGRLLRLLAVAERRGDAEDLEEVLRSLAEVDVRRGACARALEWSDRAVDVCAAAGLSPGPVWYTAAVAQTAGGDLDRAAELARRAVRASRQEHDLVFLSRGLLALGVAQLAAGRAADAVTALRRVAESEGRQRVADPCWTRWSPTPAWSGRRRCARRPGAGTTRRRPGSATAPPDSRRWRCRWRRAGRCWRRAGSSAPGGAGPPPSPISRKLPGSSSRRGRGRGAGWRRRRWTVRRRPPGPR
ncbi:tetratricopeptide repeat protein [Actinomadura atramentaria]|uniref:tetratricopeptide repeat protein n=1 Tax=Actinomadura atramentaria TaxID=1990 RepID=UPI0003A3BEF9|nr:hypothetical protein [Actinomadura atramentaria]